MGFIFLMITVEIKNIYFDGFYLFDDFGLWIYCTKLKNILYVITINKKSKSIKQIFIY